MAASLRRPRSPATGPLDVDDLLSEILLRLPPQPSSLPRASLVCRRWRSLVSDAGFSRRFRFHHRRNPPLLGFFDRGYFRPTLESPNRVPPWRLSLQADDADCPICLGCRHGLVLILLPRRLQVLVWDPVTSDQHRIALPSRFSTKKTVINGAVLRDAGDVHFKFQVVLVMADYDANHSRALACVYLSETGVWRDLISTPVPSRTRLPPQAAVLVGDSFYWLLAGFAYCYGILEFDLDRQRLAVIQAPVDKFDEEDVTITQAECGGLGFLFLSDFSIQLWNRKNDCNDAASWVLGRTIELDKLLSLSLEEKRRIPRVIGFAEYNNVVFVETISGIFMVHLESLQFKKLSENDPMSCHPFESVYATGT